MKSLKTWVDIAQIVVALCTLAALIFGVYNLRLVLKQSTLTEDSLVEVQKQYKLARTQARASQLSGFAELTDKCQDKRVLSEQNDLFGTLASPVAV